MLHYKTTQKRNPFSVLRTLIVPYGSMIKIARCSCFEITIVFQRQQERRSSTKLSFSNSSLLVYLGTSDLIVVPICDEYHPVRGVR